eukprot:4362602-Amphidinium_carterae.1
MKNEWENILQPHAAQLLSLEESKRVRHDPTMAKRIIPTRWVLVEKDMGTGTATKAKARLVLQGYKDPDLGEFEVSSPTLSRDALPFVLLMVASRKWQLFVGDIKGAFMTSRPLQRECGDLYASLPKLWVHPELANPVQLVLVKVAWYGLGDGPREFYESLSAEALLLGCQRHPLDPCTYLWFHSGRLQGIFGVTVDDMIGGGTDLFWSQ